MTLGVSAVAVLALVWVGLMSYINSQSSTLEVHVAGTVDRVAFYQEGQPDTPVAEIVTQGRDVDTTIGLRQAARFSLLGQSEPAGYYFVTSQGEESYTSRRVCCATGLAHRGTVTIRALDQWEQHWAN